MSERARMLGERVEIRQQKRRVAVNCSALQERLRSLLSPALEGDDLNRDAILDAAVVLHSELGELAVLSAKLSVLNRELGA